MREAPEAVATERGRVALNAGTRRLVDRLIAVLRPERVVLFGSFARGQSNLGSDVDLLIVGRWPGGEEHWLRRAQQLTEGALPRIDVVLCTPEQAAGDNNTRAPFLRSALESGITLYLCRSC
jgi:predicted nucleotidyltransferase